MKLDGLFPGLMPLSRNTPFAGPAFTVKVKVGPRDSFEPGAFNISSYIDAAAAGEVIIIDAEGLPVSLMGGIAVLVAQRRGLSGIVVHGGVRDGDEISATRFPVHARHVVPVSGRTRISVEAIQSPIKIDGSTITPGDIVVGDGSGVVRVPANHSQTILQSVERVARRDALARAAVMTGANFAEAFADADRQLKSVEKK